jgi:hypothetical protein
MVDYGSTVLVSFETKSPWAVDSQSLRWSRNSPPVMETKQPLPCSLEPATWPHTEPSESTLHSHILLITTQWRHIGEWRHSSTHSLTLALDGGEWSASRPGHFAARERAPGTHWIGDWLGPRAGLDTVVEKKNHSLCRDSNPPIIRPVVQRYTTELTRLSMLYFSSDLAVKVLHAFFVSSLIWSSSYLVKNTNDEVPRYVVFLFPLFPFFRLKYSPQHFEKC